MLDKIVESIDNEMEIKQIDEKSAIDLIVSSWNKVSETCIKNCFRKAGFENK